MRPQPAQRGITSLPREGHSESRDCTGPKDPGRSKAGCPQGNPGAPCSLLVTSSPGPHQLPGKRPRTLAQIHPGMALNCSPLLHPPWLQMATSSGHHIFTPSPNRVATPPTTWGSPSPRLLQTPHKSLESSNWESGKPADFIL